MREKFDQKYNYDQIRSNCVIEIELSQFHRPQQPARGVAPPPTPQLLRPEINLISCQRKRLYVKPPTPNFLRGVGGKSIKQCLLLVLELYTE